MSNRGKSDSRRCAELICQCCGRLCRIMNGVLARGGLNVSLCQALSALDAGAEMTMRQFARQLGITEGSATSVADRLVGDGLVERRRDPDDRRIVKVRLTPKGEEALTRDRTALAEFWSGIIERVPSDKREAFFEVYEEMLKMAEESTQNPPVV